MQWVVQQLTITILTLLIGSLLKVPVTSWFDDPNDTELLDLLPFFEALEKVDNVLTVLGQNNSLQSSSSTHSPIPPSIPSSLQWHGKS